MGDSTKDISLQLQKLSRDLESQAIPATAPWGKHLQGKLYPFALESIDESLKEDPNNVEAKLWWFVLQIRLKKMPATALGPSYSSLTTKLEDDKNKNLAGFAGIEIGLQLLKKNQIKQAIPTLEKAEELLNSNLLKQSLYQIYSIELERAKARKESKNYLENIEQRLDELKSYSEKIVFDQEKTIHKSSEISAKSILEASQIDETAFEPNERKKNKIILPAIVAVVLVITAVSTYETFDFKSLSLDASELDNRLAAPIKINKQNPLQFTLATATIKANFADNKYANISERLESLAVRRKEEAQERQLEEEKRIEEEKKREEILQEQQEIEPAIISSEQMDYDISEIPDDPTAEKRELEKNAPLLDPTRLSRIELTPLDASRKRTSVNKLEPNRRTADSVPYPGPGFEAKNLQGEELKAYAVEKFVPVKEFITTTRTYVTASPSAYSNRVAHLEEKTIITVTRRLGGQWLEVRSQSGQIGYIRDQNARER